MIAIRVEGAVKKPGIYSVAEGTSVEEVLGRAKCHRDAILEAILLDTPLTEEQTIFIPDREYLAITATGCVKEEGVFHVPLGTRVSDLKKILPLLPDADRSLFRSRRYVRHLDHFSVERRKKKQSLEIKSHLPI